VSNKRTIPKVNTPLTELQLGFANHYMQCWNGTEAARLAGYAGGESALAKQAHENLRNPKIVAYIEAQLSTEVMSANEVLARLTNIARATFDDFMDDSGLIDTVKAKRKKKLALVARVKDKHFINHKDETETHEMEIELYSALDALKTLAKYHQLITTQTLKIDWQAMAIEQIKAGRISYEALVQEFDTDLATQLFMAAHVPIT
jgi:phage terminase small subunit